MNNYVLVVNTVYGEVHIPMQADDSSAVNVIAEIYEDNHGDVLSTHIEEA